MSCLHAWTLLESLAFLNSAMQEIGDSVAFFSSL